MKLRDLAGDDFPEAADILAGPAGDVDILGLSSDSRQIAEGMLFAALAGSKADGSRFVDDAAAKGAVVAIASHPADSSIPVVVVDNPRRFLAIAAARLYGAQPETMVAVTGTAGKTSVASFTRQIWAYAGHAAAQIGTTGVVSPDRND